MMKNDDIYVKLWKSFWKNIEQDIIDIIPNPFAKLRPNPIWTLDKMTNGVEGGERDEMNSQSLGGLSADFPQ